MDLSQLFELHRKQLGSLRAPLRRYLYDRIRWGNRLNVIVGMRGVGKTTMILQRIQEKYGDSDKALYVLGDSTIVNEAGLLDVALEFERLGGKYLAIDEIHKYPNWKQELKNIYDSLPGLKTVVSGSSSIDIMKGQYDLSRRAVLYNLRGLSFREFINFRLKKDVFPEAFKLESVLKRQTEYSSEVTRKLSANKRKVLKLFRTYLETGYYPYFLEGVEEYQLRVNNALSKVLYEDIPVVYGVDRSSLKHIQKMIFLVASSAPFSPNISRMSSDLGISRDSVYLFLEYLDNAGVLSFLRRADHGAKAVRKPEKIYLSNSNLFYAIESKERLSTSIGAIREAFALDQLEEKHKVLAPGKGDFLVDNRYTFEVGGQSKQVPKDAQSSNFYVFKDGIEAGSGNTIPLWLLGFLY